MLKVLYTIFLAIMLAFFIGLGIEAFYTTPKAPEYPSELQYNAKAPSEMTPQLQQMQKDYDQKMKDWQKENSVHSRNTSMLAVACSIIILVLSLTLLQKISILSDGFLLGGLLTLLYAIIRGFGSDDSKFRFLLVSVGLLVALIFGYIKFIMPAEKKFPLQSAKRLPRAVRIVSELLYNCIVYKYLP